MKLRNRLVGLLSVLVLSACGGGGNHNNNGANSATGSDSTSTNTSSDANGSNANGGNAATPLPPAGSETAASKTVGSVSGSAIASDTGQPLANVEVIVAGKSVATANDGSFKQEGVPTSARTVFRFTKSGYAETFVTASVTEAGTGNVTARMAPIAASVTYDNHVGTTLVDPVSAASVSLAPSALVNYATGAAPVGPVTVSVASINPVANPANMPGDYTSNTGDTIESFGAITVQLHDSAGNRLNLAPGQVSTIRIPLSTRSPTPPASIPLYYFNETTGFWIEEGRATLAGTAPNRYYEGTVTHFTVWNADVRIQSVFVNGCVVDPEGKPFVGTYIRSEGIDYSGYALAFANREGKFRIAVRLNSTFRIEATYPRNSTAVVAGPFAAEATLPSCLTLQPSSQEAKPAPFAGPFATSVQVGTPAYFSVLATGLDVKYQWLRNGQPIPGANEGYYYLPTVSMADNNAQFSLRLTNQSGSVTTGAAALTVYAPPAADTVKLIQLSYLSSELSELATLPVGIFIDNQGYRWINPATVCSIGSATAQLNGQAIPVGTPVVASNALLVSTFNNCQTPENLNETLNGTARLNLNLDAQFQNGSITSQLTNMRRVTTNSSVLGDADLSGNGPFVFAISTTVANGVETEVTTTTPGANATLRNNTTGQVVSYLSGSTRSTAATTVSNNQTQITFEQANLTYTFQGDTYTANGTISYSSNIALRDQKGSGQILLTKNGVLAGRIFATSQGQFFEVDGVVRPLSNALSAAPRSFKAKVAR